MFDFPLPNLTEDLLIYEIYQTLLWEWKMNGCVPTDIHVVGPSDLSDTEKQIILERMKMYGWDVSFQKSIGGTILKVFPC